MTLVAAHVVAAVVALAAGAVVLVRLKGTDAHRRWGRVYAVALAVMALTSFGVFELRGGPSVFHVVSVLTLAVLGAGVVVARRRGRGWRRHHAVLLPVSYLMLVVTGTAQFFDHLPLPSEALNAIVFLQAPMLLGGAAIVRSARRLPAS